MFAEAVLPVRVEDAYRLWSVSYDDDPNPILALERRVIRERLGAVSGKRVLDIGTGTGYWLAYARSGGARAFGVDLSEEMLAVAARKDGLRNWLIRADMNRLPVRDGAADIAICSMAIGYIPELKTLLRELARVSQRIIVSDLHPAAVEAGWRRGFVAAGHRYEIEHFPHTAPQLDEAAAAAGLRLHWRSVAHLDEPERAVFARAGRAHSFAAACDIPALLATCWVRP
jgi:SAM-dependent methyltransferase